MMNDFRSYLMREYESHKKQAEFTPGKSYIAPSGASIVFDDIESVVDAVVRGWFTEFSKAREFKEALKSVSSKQGVTLVNSGSSANLVALSSIAEENSNPYVITCAASFPTTVAPIYQTGRIPIYVDIDAYTLLPNYSQIEDAFELYSDKILGAILIHNLGFVYNEKRIKDLMDSDQFLIVDGCDAMGSRSIEQSGDYLFKLPVGNCGDILTYSFFPAHVITTGEGGAVLTNHSYLHENAESYVNWGRSCTCLPGQSNVCGHRFDWPYLGNLPEGFDHKYIFDRIGYNLKMTEMQAALGLSQISRLEYFISERQENYHKLYDSLNGLYYSHGMFCYKLNDGVNPFGFPMLMPDREVTQKFISYLEEHKVGTRRFFAGNIIRQPGYSGLPYVAMSKMKGADVVMDKLIWIACNPSLDDDKISYMVDTINSFWRSQDNE